MSIMYSQSSAMSRRSGQSLVAIVGAFVVISILSYYSWSLSSENTALKGTIIMSYSKLKDMTSHKTNLERKNLVLSNRMIEMEDARDTEKQNAETELLQKKKCEKKLTKSKDECSVKVAKKQEMLSRCEDSSVQRESFLMEALNDVQLETLDHTAQSDVVMAKIKQLKSKLKSTKLDYIALQNKFSDLEKEKMKLQESNEKLVVSAKRIKGSSTKSEVSKASQSTLAKKNVDQKKKKSKQKHNKIISKRVNKTHLTANKMKTEQSQEIAMTGPVNKESVSYGVKTKKQVQNVSQIQSKATEKIHKMGNINAKPNVTQSTTTEQLGNDLISSAKSNDDTVHESAVQEKVNTSPTEEVNKDATENEDAKSAAKYSDENRTSIKKNTHAGNTFIAKAAYAKDKNPENIEEADNGQDDNVVEAQNLENRDDSEHNANKADVQTSKTETLPTQSDAKGTDKEDLNNASEIESEDSNIEEPGGVAK